MVEILFINACVREGSRTLGLAKHVLSKLSGNITELHLDKLDCKPLDGALIAERDRALAENDTAAPILKYAQQFANADEIVIAAPFWDLSFPALLKVYLENITVCGVTFKYNETGMPVGMCNGKRVFIVTTCGGPCIPTYGIEYIRTLMTVFYGIPSVEAFTADGLDIFGNDIEAILKSTQKKIDDYFVK